MVESCSGTGPRGFMFLVWGILVVLGGHALNLAGKSFFRKISVARPFFPRHNWKISSPKIRLFFLLSCWGGLVLAQAQSKTKAFLQGKCLQEGVWEWESGVLRGSWGVHVRSKRLFLRSKRHFLSSELPFLRSQRHFLSSELHGGFGNYIPGRLRQPFLRSERLGVCSQHRGLRSERLGLCPGHWGLRLERLGGFGGVGHTSGVAAWTAVSSKVSVSLENNFVDILQLSCERKKQRCPPKTPIKRESF